MRIGIDARMCGPAHSGLGRYVEQLVKHLEHVSPDDDAVTIFLRKENWDIVTPKRPRWKKVLADIPWYGWEEQYKLPSLIRGAGVDLMHFPHWNVPRWYSGLFVVTIHDLIMWHFPRAEASTHGPVVYWAKDLVSRLVLRSAAHRAAHIFTTSEFTKNDLHRTLRVPNEKMTVTYQAPFARLSDVPPADLSSFGITKPYVLYVGNAYPHKNLDRLVEAWQTVDEKTAGAYELVLAGKNNFFYEKLSRAIERLGCRNIILTGFVPDATLRALYARARLFVAPSRYEGFALSGLEALAHDVPVVASSASCFPEVFGEAAVYFSPEDTNAIADAILHVMRDEDTRSFLRERGRGELRRYSWEALAHRTRQMYQAVLQNPGL